ncbi:hypothetical protein QUF80_14810 [Desulfococcaceae bacterium HSG8]|nr:hypothetical protein [Desulfococcaceae bacterium HSG8]
MVRICQSEPSSRQGLSERFYYDARGGIGKSPAPHMVRICQSEPSNRQGLSERFYYDARGGLANSPHLTGFGFVNPNRAGRA